MPSGLRLSTIRCGPRIKRVTFTNWSLARAPMMRTCCVWNGISACLFHNRMRNRQSSSQRVTVTMLCFDLFYRIWPLNDKLSGQREKRPFGGSVFPEPPHWTGCDNTCIQSIMEKQKSQQLIRLSEGQANETSCFWGVLFRCQHYLHGGNTKSSVVKDYVHCKQLGIQNRN